MLAASPRLYAAVPPLVNATKSGLATPLGGLAIHAPMPSPWTWSSGGALPAAREGMGGAGTQTAALGNGGANPGASNATLLYNGSTWTASPGNMNTARARSI